MNRATSGSGGCCLHRLVRLCGVVCHKVLGTQCDKVEKQIRSEGNPNNPGISERSAGPKKKPHHRTEDHHPSRQWTDCGLPERRSGSSCIIQQKCGTAPAAMIAPIIADATHAKASRAMSRPTSDAAQQKGCDQNGKDDVTHTLIGELLFYDELCTPPCTAAFPNLYYYHRFMNPDLRMSIKNYRP